MLCRGLGSPRQTRADPHRVASLASLQRATQRYKAYGTDARAGWGTDFMVAFFLIVLIGCVFPAAMIVWVLKQRDT